MKLECSVGIAKVSLKAKEKDGIVARTVRMTLIREFDPLVARAVGGDARELLASLRTHAASKVEIPIDGIAGQARLSGEKGEAVVIKNLTGVKAIGKAARGEDDSEPKIELIFDCPFALKAWDWLGQNVGGRADMEFSKSQLELGLGVTAGPSAKPVKDGKVEPDEVGVHEEEPARAAADTDEQGAGTPEEAELLRSERLTRERGLRIEQVLGGATAGIEVTENLEDAFTDTAFTASVSFRGIRYEHKGATGDAARESVVAALRDFITEDEERSPWPPPSSREREIAALAEQQAVDEARTKKSLLRVPTKGPRPTARRTLSTVGPEARARRPKPAKAPKAGKGKGRR